MRGKLVALATAVLLVALGTTLGAGPLQHGAAARDRDLARAKATIAQRDVTIEGLGSGASLAQAYADASAGRVVAGTLTGRKVAVLSMPGADARTVDRLADLVRSAGGEVTARVTLKSGLLAESGRGLLDALTSQMVTQTSGLGVPADANAYQRLGALLVRAIGVPASSRSVSASYDAPAISIVAGLVAAKVIEKAEVTARAGLTLVVLPASKAPKTDQAAATALAAYVGQVLSVVAGPGAAARVGGLLAGIRADTGLTVSTVDSLDSPVGAVSAVLALAARTRGVHGDYGTVGKTDAAVPPLP